MVRHFIRTNLLQNFLHSRSRPPDRVFIDGHVIPCYEVGSQGSPVQDLAARVGRSFFGKNPGQQALTVPSLRGVVIHNSEIICTNSS
jgi:hypothetical protein